MRRIVSILDLFLYPSFSAVARWIAIISAASFFIGYGFGYLSARRTEISNAVKTLRAGQLSVQVPADEALIDR